MCIQVSQEAGKVVWYPHLFKNFPQFAVTCTVKGFIVVNEAEVDIFLELPCFFDNPTDVGNLISGSSAFSKSSLKCIEVPPIETERYLLHLSKYTVLYGLPRWC